MPRVAQKSLSESGSTIPHAKGIFDPVARALDVLGDRWTLVLMRHLILEPRGFQELRVRTGIAPRVLSSRLRDLASAGFVESKAAGGRSLYTVTEQGHSLDSVISSLARWYIFQGMRDLEIDPSRFTETSAQSVIEALPFLLREERTRDIDLTFEIRLTGEGGGVWTVRIADGVCTVRAEFAERADVRYTADSRVWCGVALGLKDAREAYQNGEMIKEGGHAALDHFFHQISRPGSEDQQFSKEPPGTDPQSNL